MNKREILNKIHDPRCPFDAEIKIRVVDTRHSDGVHGSYRSMELPIDGSFTGWKDGHWSILVFGPVPDDCAGT